MTHDPDLSYYQLHPRAFKWGSVGGTLFDSASAGFSIGWILGSLRGCGGRFAWQVWESWPHRGVMGVGDCERSWLDGALGSAGVVCAGLRHAGCIWNCSQGVVLERSLLAGQSRWRLAVSRHVGWSSRIPSGLAWRQKWFPVPPWELPTSEWEPETELRAQVEAYAELSPPNVKLH